LDSKQTAFVAIMSALGTFLSGITLHVAPISINLPGQGGAALDLSHVATFIAAIFGGPYIGALTGFLSGIYAGYYFGYVIGSLGLVSLIGVPIGKALTGLAAGFLYKKLVKNTSKSSTLSIPIILISYIPECIFTVFYFLYLLPFMIPIVIPKAWIEIAIMSFLIGALVGNTGFKEFILRFFSTPKIEKTPNIMVKRKKQ